MAGSGVEIYRVRLRVVRTQTCYHRLTDLGGKTGNYILRYLSFQITVQSCLCLLSHLVLDNAPYRRWLESISLSPASGYITTS